VIALIKAAYAHKGIAVLDIVSPCVTFNNHEGSTKSYTFVKEHDVVLQELGYIAPQENIEVEIKDGETQEITLHDGSRMTVKKLGRDYDFKDPVKAIDAIHQARAKQELITGLLYHNPDFVDHAELMNLGDRPLNSLTETELDPGPEVLAKINKSWK
jgi:2-oxoglutarate ferredoxin oxidoreductase subunit beta